MFIVNFFKILISGFFTICSILAKGFYFYPKQLFVFLGKIFKTDKFNKIVKYYEKRQGQPEFCLLFILYVIAILTFIKILYVKPQEVVHNDIDFEIEENINSDSENLEDDNSDVSELQPSESQPSEDSSNNSNSNNGIVIDTNPYRLFAKTSLDGVNFNDLKSQNSDTVAWISVDGTNINYPIVQTDNNDYYLDHSFDKSYKKTGWTYMDYRNSIDMTDNNTIFYGHNLLNKTAFGSIANIFTDDWVNNSNHSIVILTEGKKYIYKVFSAYYIDPEIYYLQTIFYSDSEYQSFLNTLSARNIINIDDSVLVTDKIITLSTCTEDNKGRKVVHAKLISVS